MAKNAKKNRHSVRVTHLPPGKVGKRAFVPRWYELTVAEFFLVC